jgi:signal recognition particle subunit SRP68
MSSELDLALNDGSKADIRRHLQLLLFTAERAMTHSHELKALATKPGSPRTTRKDQISWLRRAVKVSTSLYDISSSIASSPSGQLSQKTLAEITIYHLSLRAELAFEHSNWAEALTDLAARRKLLSTLSEAARDSYDQALAIEFIDQYDPLIRFSAYKLGRNESHDIDGVVKDIDAEMMEESVPGFGKLVEGLRGETGAEEMEQGRKTLQDVQFAGEKVEMRNAEIVEVMLRVQESLGKLKGKADSGSGRGMKGWDKVLSVLGEAEGVARRLLDDHDVSSNARVPIVLQADMLRHLDPTTLCARQRRHNPSPSHISTLSTSYCRTEYGEISSWSKR